MTVKRMLEIPRWLEELQRGIFGVFQKLSPPGVVRVSMGLENTPADIDELIAVLSEIARQARKEASAEAKKAQPDIAKQLDEYAANVIARVYGAPAVPSQP
ncbi:MAG: hypothetical protein IPK16_14490 [Anaerolineales bacterium]|nr:hypothetical protein [Anaerolineales bacterium]